MSDLYTRNKTTRRNVAPTSLQLSCVDSILRSTKDGEVLAETLEYLKAIYLPSHIIEFIFVEVCKGGMLSKRMLTLLVSLELITLDFTGVDLATAQEDLFDGFLSCETSCVQRLILDSVYLEPCIFKFFATTRYQEYVPNAVQNLLHLHLNECDSLTDEFVTFFADSFPQLESLYISSCPLLTPNAIITITNASFAQTLKALDISDNAASPRGLSFLTNLTAIEELDISNMKCQLKKSFRFIVSSPNLKVLYMSRLFISDDDMKYILSGGDIPNNIIFSKLLELRMTESSLSSAALCAIVQQSCPTKNDFLSLQKLDLSWTNENLDNSGLETLVAKCRDLKELRLQSTNAEESTFLTITATCPKLQVLHFSRCIPDSLNLCALTSLKNLTSLNVAWASFSSQQLDDWVETFEQYMPNLEELSLQGCQDVSEHFINLLTTQNSLLPTLLYLDLGWVNACSTAMAEELSRSRPHMEVTDYYMQVFQDGRVIANELTDSW